MIIQLLGLSESLNVGNREMYFYRSPGFPGYVIFVDKLCH